MSKVVNVTTICLFLSAASIAKSAPNIVFLFVDNVGYGDLGCYGNDQVITPNIDRLASQGVRCTDFYIGSPSCMPSRAALLTGRHPLRNGLNRQLWKEPSEVTVGLNHDEKLIPQYLRPLGFATGCFGKWNIGFATGSRPTERGFDEFFGHASGNMHYYEHQYNGRHDLYRGTEHDFTKGYATDLIADAACDFIRRHVDQEFFAYVPFNAAHFPNKKNHRPGQPVIWQAPDDVFGRYGWSPDETDPKRRYQAVLTALDDGIGQVVATVDKLGLSENTIVIFLSDNGAFMLPDRGLEVASNAPLRSGGVTLWEGGIRVPCCIRWPGQFAAGSVCREPLWSMDFLPMFLATSNFKSLATSNVKGHATSNVKGHATSDAEEFDRVIDGRNPIPVLAGDSKSPHDFLAFRYSKQSALRSGEWKIIRESDSSSWQLYNLREDIGETEDLAERHGEIVERLSKKFRDWETTVVVEPARVP